MQGRAAVQVASLSSCPAASLLLVFHSLMPLLDLLEQNKLFTAGIPVLITAAFHLVLEF